MIDLPNKIDNNFESNETTAENNFEHTFESAKISILNTEDNTEDSLVKLDDNNVNINDEISEDIPEDDSETIDTTSAGTSTEDSEILKENSEISNCLALTVKKDYNIAVVKNVVVRTFKGIWKVAISIFTLNIIKFFF